MAASMSEQMPSAGFAVIPENESDPPQFSPSMILDAGQLGPLLSRSLLHQLVDLAARGSRAPRGCRRSIAASLPTRRELRGRWVPR